MTKLLEKLILRTLPIFYAQATATPMWQLNFGTILLLFRISSAIEAPSGDSLFIGSVVLLFLAGYSIWIVASLAFLWDWLVFRFVRSTRN
jgi:hypothetical protein